MTKEKLIQCLSTIDAHFGKKPDAEARRENPKIARLTPNTYKRKEITL